MRAETFHFELLTHAFCGGAEPQAHAEIRAASIRGQLRWWFRTLGGFRSLDPLPTQQQEAEVFGSAAGDRGICGRLLVRVEDAQLQCQPSNAEDLGGSMGSPLGYLLFPLRAYGETDGRRGALKPGSKFQLGIQWRGDPRSWQDIVALVAIFGHLGSLGFRGRRAMGAIGFEARQPMDLTTALHHFRKPEGVLVRSLGEHPREQIVAKLAIWLKSCRAHGRSGNNQAEQASPYFGFAKRDHDIGYQIPGTDHHAAFRPALGLPIIQRTRARTNNWEWSWSPQKRRTEGRFASPVLLRPHRDLNGRWHALVIFVNAHQWPDDPKTGAPRAAVLNGRPRSVSRDLYDAMKADRPGWLRPFP